jgi:hypothetical protein
MNKPPTNAGNPDVATLPENSTRNRAREKNSAEEILDIGCSLIAIRPFLSGSG